MTHASYGFKGDTFAESMNNSMKNGAITVDGRMNVDRSGQMQMQMVDNRTHLGAM